MSFAACSADKPAKCSAERFVQMSGEGAIEIVFGDQFDDVGEILVRPAQIPLAAGDFRFDQLRQRQDGQALDLGHGRFVARVGKSHFASRASAISGIHELHGDSSG